MTAGPAVLARQMLGNPHPGPVRRWLGVLLTRYYRLTGQARYDRTQLLRVRGTPILVLPTVFNPRILRSGEFFATVIERDRLGQHGLVLDLGTGSGICAVFASRHARRVVAVDLNRAAVRCAGINAGINGVDDRIECRHGDLFDAVAGERFDAVFFNPPFYAGAPVDARDAAWRGVGLESRFARGLDRQLSPGGRAYLLLSTCGDACPRFIEELARAGFALTVHAVQQYVNERLTIVEARRPGE